MLIVSVWLNQTVTVWIRMMDFEWKWKFFRAHSLSFEIYIQFLIRPVWQTYLKICALILQMKADVAHQILMHCTGTDAAELMLIHWCFYSAVCYCELEHTFLYKEKHVRWLCCVLPVYENLHQEMHNVHIAQRIFSPTFMHLSTFIHFHPFHPCSATFICLGLFQITIAFERSKS